MTDLLLIHPGGAGDVYQQLADEFTAIEPPLWCRLIAGYCRDRGHSVAILDAEAEHMSPLSVAGYVVGMKPRLVCVVAYGHQPSASTQSMPAVIEICHKIKKFRPTGQQIIVVGGHAAALPELTLEETGADYVCTGEGPVTVSDILFGIHEPAAVAMDTFFTEAAPLLDVKDLHGDVWDLLPMDKYRAHNWQCMDGSPRQPYASIYTTLGCPYSCSFCCINAPFGGPGYRRRDPAAVVGEVIMLCDRYNVRTFKIADEMFVLNDRHVEDICLGLAALPWAAELNIWAYARVDTIKEKQLPLLRAAGIRWLCLGIESGSAMVRDGAEKPIDSDDIFRIVRMIQDADINVLGNFIFGLPDDTMETMTETLSLAKDLNCEFSNFYSAMAYPGSALYQPVENDNWSAYSQHSFECRPMSTKTLSSSEVLGFRDWSFEQYFGDTEYLNMIADKFGFDACNHLARMSQIKLPRKLLE